MKRLALLLSLALLACHRTPQTVLVPVAVPCPPPPKVQRPRLPIVDLKPGDSPDLIQKALLASIQLLQGYAQQLETILDGYNPEPKK